MRLISSVVLVCLLLYIANLFVDNVSATYSGDILEQSDRSELQQLLNKLEQ